MSKVSKASMDNHSRQLNGKDATYWSSRGLTPPADVAPLEPDAPAPSARRSASGREVGQVMAAHLPASTEILGMFVDALEAGRYASGAKSCTLRDRTGRRGFAGSVRTRHWCCRLSGLLDFLISEGLIDDARVDALTRALGLFLPFAAAMQRWDSFNGHTDASVRAHFRIAAVELASRIRLLACAGFDFGVLGDTATPPTWMDLPTKGAPLAALRAAAGEPSLTSIADAIDFREHAVGRWFTKGQRPSREALQVLAKHFAKVLGREWSPIYRQLYWHYALADVVRRLEKWVTPEDAGEIARVAAAVAHCGGQRTEDLSSGARVFVAALIAPPAFVVDHAIVHGAGEDWALDAAAVDAQYACAGVEGIHDARAQVALVLAHLPPKRRTAPVRRRATLKPPTSGSARATS